VSAYYIELSTYIFSLCLIIGYHLYLRANLRRDRSYTIQSVNSRARKAWVDNIMSDRSIGILGVQTLRNSTMAATFLASTAILLMMGTMNLMQNSSDKTSFLQSLESNMVGSSSLEEAKLMALLVIFFWAFFSFTMAVRMYNHVGFLLNSANEKHKFYPSPRYVARLLNRSGRYYSLGMRAYYFSIPLVFGLFNPYYLVVASIGLVVVLYHIDRAPDSQPLQNDIKMSENGGEAKLELKVGGKQ
jgi:uncharacterized membrane protein